jgi:predicted phage terminase large subunit-like protein
MTDGFPLLEHGDGDGFHDPMPDRPLLEIETPAEGLTPQQAALEMLRRQRARNSLTEYARAIDIPGAPVSADPDAEQFKPVETSLALHHLILLENIERTIMKAAGRLMVFGPPGMAKSSYTSVVTPAWCLSRSAGYRVILTSYASKIADKQSRKCRALVRQPRHIAIWPDRPVLAKDQKAVNQWALSNNSEFMSGGILSGITGNRANGIVIDDPISGREAADSETIRDKTYDEYIDSITTRLLPGGWVILIQTRWHQDDLAGRILPENYDGRSGEVLCRDGQTWTVLNFTAKCEREDDPLGRSPGDYLWPEWFPQSHWAQWEHNPRAARTWAALYQQRPTLGEGLDFKREWFKWYDPDVEPGKPGGLPEQLTIYGASDYATKEARGDFTEHGIVGLDREANFWILDWWYGQRTTDVTIDHFINLVGRHRPRRWWNEGGPIDSAIRPAVETAMREAVPPVHVHIDTLTSIKNKSIKLASFQARAAQGKVYLPLRRPWATRLLDQLCAFPAVTHDDACDVMGLIGRGIDAMMSPHAQSVPERRILVPFTAAWLEATEEEPMKPRYS